MDKLNIGADEAKRWRDKALRGRRRGLTRGVVSWALILVATIILCGLIALKNADGADCRHPSSSAAAGSGRSSPADLTGTRCRL